MARKIVNRMGKAQAREEFSALIDAVRSGAGAIEITDYGKVAAVLLSEQEYLWLRACSKQNQEPKRNPRGVMVLLDDQALDDAANEIREDFEQSIRKTVSQL